MCESSGNVERLRSPTTPLPLRPRIREFSGALSSNTSASPADCIAGSPFRKRAPLLNRHPWNLPLVIQLLSADAYAMQLCKHGPAISAVSRLTTRRRRPVKATGSGIHRACAMGAQCALDGVRLAPSRAASAHSLAHPGLRRCALPVTAACVSGRGAIQDGFTVHQPARRPTWAQVPEGIRRFCAPITPAATAPHTHGMANLADRSSSARTGCPTGLRAPSRHCLPAPQKPGRGTHS
jgi:hypothetical protein